MIEGSYCCRNNINHPAMKTFCLKALLSSSTFVWSPFQTRQEISWDCADWILYFYQGWSLTRIADWVCFGKWQINKIDFVEKDLIFWPVAESPVLITSSECTPAGEGHNYDKLFPHKVKVGISGLFIQVTFGESESLFCPVTKTDISLLSQLSCCTQACLYNDCTTPVQRVMLQIEWS